MSRLPWDPHRTKKKPSALASTISASTSVSKSTAAQLVLRRGGTAAAKDESIEFFSALRKCQPDHHVSGQTERGTPDRRGKARRGCDGNDDELLSTEIGKHDYDWLLTPPASPLLSPATSAAGHQVSAAVPSRLARTRLASCGKSNSRLALTCREDENPTSRLARRSSATHSRSSVNTPAIASSGRPSHVRTLSSASSSSINTASNASASSTPRGSVATSPRTLGTARSAAATARSRRLDNAQARQVSGSVTGQPKASPSSNSGLLAQTSTRPRATTGASKPRTTSTATSQQPALARRGSNAVARSRLAIQSTTGSTAQAASPEPQPRDVSTYGARSRIIKPRPLPVAAKQCHGNGLAAVSTTTQTWPPSPSPAVAVAQSAPSRDPLAIRSSRNGDGQKINVEKATPRRTAGIASAAMRTSLTRTSSRQLTNTNAKLTVNKNDGEPAFRKPTVHQRSIRSVVSRSRLGLMAATSDAGPTSRGRFTSEKGKLTAAAAVRVAKPDAFPSTRYDAMLLREDPKNLTWLNGCDDDGSSGGADSVEGSLEPLDVPAPAGMSGTAVRF